MKFIFTFRIRNFYSIFLHSLVAKVRLYGSQNHHTWTARTCIDVHLFMRHAENGSCDLNFSFASANPKWSGLSSVVTRKR